MTIKHFVFNPFMENTYLIYDHTGEAAIIDAGCNSVHEYATLSNYITEQKLTLKYVLNTHLHLDHQFGNAYLFETYGIAPMAHRADAPFIETIPAQAAMYGLPLERQPIAVTHFLQHGDEICVGQIKLQVLHTPGHSKGGVCFYCKSEQTVFAGDTLFKGSIGRTDLPGGDYDELIRSIQRQLLTLPDETRLFCGHGESTTIGQERAMNPFL